MRSPASFGSAAGIGQRDSESGAKDDRVCSAAAPVLEAAPSLFASEAGLSISIHAQPLFCIADGAGPSRGAVLGACVRRVLSQAQGPHVRSDGPDILHTLGFVAGFANVPPARRVGSNGRPDGIVILVDH